MPIKVPKAMLIATGEEGQKPYDGSVQYLFADDDHVTMDELDVMARVEGDGEHEPDFAEGDVEWQVEDD